MNRCRLSRLVDNNSPSQVSEQDKIKNIEEASSKISQKEISQELAITPLNSEQIAEVNTDQVSDIALANIAEPVIEQTANIAINDNTVADQEVNKTLSQNPPEPVEIEKTEEVSQELLDLFKSAVQETDSAQHDFANIDNSNLDEDVPSLMDMPASFQNKIPELHFQMHIYASDGSGWVKVNDQEKRQGDRITAQLRLERIERGFGYFKLPRPTI